MEEMPRTPMDISVGAEICGRTVYYGQRLVKGRQESRRSYERKSLRKERAGSERLACRPNLGSRALDGGDDLAVLEDAHRAR